MAKVEIKQPIVDEIAGYLADAQAMVLVDYRGLTVEEDTQLRKALREAGVDYKGYKNTLIKRAVKGTVFEAVTDLCEGPTAIATSASDATAPARVLYEAAKKMPNLELKGGVVDGTFYDEGYRYNSIKRSTARKITWKYPVPYYQLCSCY